MKKTMFILFITVGIGLLAFGFRAMDTSAQETELFMSLAMDIDDQEYEDQTYRMRRLRGQNGPLLFIGLGETIQEDILNQATLLNIEVAHYILAKTVSTYDNNYDFDTIISIIQNTSDEAILKTYLDSLNQVLLDANEAIKASLDALKETYMPQIKAIRELYQEEVRALIRDIRSADESSKQIYIDALEAVKLEIEADVQVIQEAFLLDLANENIAVEGLYGLFIHRNQDQFQSRMDMLEKRNPQLYNRIKHHFNK